MIARISRSTTTRITCNPTPDLFKTLPKTLNRSLTSQSSSNQEIYLENLLGEENAGISIIKLDRPKAANSLGRILMSQLNDILHILKEEDPINVRCVIIASNAAPKVFCAGADLRERATMTNEKAFACVDVLRNTFEDVANLPMPVIAAIEGAAYGGGLELALAADIRVATKSSMLGLVETSIGVIPGAGGTQRLPRLISPSRAKELIFTARKFSATEALHLGIIDFLVDDNNNDGDNNDNNKEQDQTISTGAQFKALQIARQIVANAPLSVRYSKSAIQRGMFVSTSMSDALLVERENYAKIIPTKDRLEGIAAFREKRKPVYRGE